MSKRNSLIKSFKLCLSRLEVHDDPSALLEFLTRPSTLDELREREMITITSQKINTTLGLSKRGLRDLGALKETENMKKKLAGTLQLFQHDQIQQSVDRVTFENPNQMKTIQKNRKLLKSCIFCS